MDKFLSDFDKKSQLHPFLERAVRRGTKWVFVTMQHVKQLSAGFLTMKEVARMDLDPSTINQPHALQIAVDSWR